MSKKKETMYLYLRCSTDKQIDNSIERQKDMGIKFSKEMNMNYKIYSDGGLSGIKSMKTRDEWMELMWEIEMGSVKHLWCEDFTRLTRNFEDGVLIDKMIIENDLCVYEGICNNQQYRPEETSQRLIKMVTSLVGTDQKKKEIQKSIIQKIKKFKQGFYVRGNVSFGFTKRTDGYLKINKEESEWVKKIFNWYDNGKSLTQIMKLLKRNNVKTKRGNDWSMESVSILLRNIEYTGVTTYTDMTKDPHRKNPEMYPYPDESKWEVHTNDNLPRIISDELFNKVQKLLLKDKPKPTKNIYFLHGKIKCKCGNDWVGRTTSVKSKYKPEGEKYSHYLCSNSDRFFHRNRQGRKHLYKESICDKPKRLPTDKLDKMVWEQLLYTLDNSSFIKERVKRDLLGGKYDTQSSRKKINKDYRELNKEIKSLEQSRTNLLKEKYLYEIDDVTFNEINKSINSKLSELNSEKEKVRMREILLDKRNEWIDWIGEHKKQVNELSRVSDTKIKRKILDIYIEEVRVEYNKETQQHTIQILYKQPLVNDGIEYVKKKGSKMKWDKWGNSYKVKKGDQLVSLSDFGGSTTFVGKPYSTVTKLSIPTKQSNLLPFLTFIYTYTSHEFVYRKTLNNTHQKLHNIIYNLKSEGLGYRKISKRLNDLGIKSHTGKDFYPSLVSMMWKKIEKKQRILNQPIVSDYSDFDIVFQSIIK